MLTKNSPLRPYLKKAAYESMQFGLEEALMAERIGPSIKQVTNTETSALTVGQFFSLFGILAGFGLVAFLTFTIELIWSKLSHPGKAYSKPSADCLDSPKTPTSPKSAIPMS
jgi:hypothetical protein